jgi:hypothetical protein
MYNHFAALVPLVSSDSANNSTWNSSLAAEDKPSWTQVSTATTLKGKGGKSKLNKEERKQLNEALTFEYLKNSDQGVRLASEMSEKLERAKRKEEVLAATLSIPVEELDVGVTMPDAIKMDCDTKMTKNRTLSITNENRSWPQRAKIVFIHLHWRNDS